MIEYIYYFFAISGFIVWAGILIIGGLILYYEGKRNGR